MCCLVLKPVGLVEIQTELPKDVATRKCERNIHAHTYLGT